MFRIRIDAITPCWYADIQGDPGRTLVPENALQWKSRGAAEIHCQALREDFPNRKFTVEPC